MTIPVSKRGKARLVTVRYEVEYRLMVTNNNEERYLRQHSKELLQDTRADEIKETYFNVEY